MTDARVTVPAPRRNDIQGLRGVSALLVVAFHVWTQRTAGAVDVFFVVSGYLLLGSLLRQHAAGGSVDLVRYWEGIVRRLMPTAAVVLVVTVLVCQFLLPETRWNRAIDEGIATALFLENYSLISFATDYLARDDVPSPFANGWAISTQVQAYALMALLMWIISRIPVAVARRRGLQLAVLGGATLVSFAYAVRLVELAQPVAYFSTFARFWEFTLGGLAAWALARGALPGHFRALAGWTGLAMLLSTGWLFGLTRQFPAWASLWPVAGAILILAAGASGGPSRAGVDRLLAWRPVAWLGGVSYGVYLWHGPIAVFTLILFRTRQLDLIQGLGVLATSILFAWLARATLERPLAWLLRPGQPQWKVFYAAVTIALVCLGVAGAWAVRAKLIDRAAPAELARSLNPGGAADPAAPLDPARPFLPRPLHARADFADVYSLGCHAGDGEATPKVCRYGPTDAPVHIAVVGSSHAAHWLPAVQEIAARRGWRVSAWTKSSCLFATTAISTSGRLAPDCGDWNTAVAAELARDRPDLVVTLASFGWGTERIPTGALDQMRRMDAAGVRVLALRDTPWFDFDVADCVAMNGPLDRRCTRPRPPGALAPPPGGWPLNVTYVDPLDWVCTPTTCPAVIGNVLVYRDKDHLTATFARTLEGRLGPWVERALEGRTR